MEEPRFGFAIVYVEDLAAAKRFYTETLGLRVQREAPAFVQFDHFALAGDERQTPGDAPELYWLVDDAEAAHRAISTKATITRPLETLPFGKVFGVRDPTGATRLFVELAAARPSRAV